MKIRRLGVAAILGFSLATAGCAGVGSGPGAQAASCRPSAETHRSTVVAFYREALIGRAPRSAFERHVSPDFIEHKPDVPLGTRDATVAFLEKLLSEVPDPRWEILRTIAEGDLVFVHARFTPANGAPPYAIADVFRLDHCLIVEHWDVVGPPREQQPNPNPRF
jgi:predicted SnoaL-like aldol condensation-catalyzing enzyme